ncbi:tetratricopeptide repeat protein [Vibrio sp. SCSIO 43135]|uniref:Tetratricopeptide repeat protein n=1 Tax=Vibrio paucivorans TaxID=2829489 RepID=A0A9X3CCW6_9VIBR|nr:MULTISPECIES: tetratricopeptide repeat protein [Vibrio]MCW8333393.1 tetratricopeptide repeat protein [Vibrio paucivorans]USD41808.1 tetratricopeptide repeat protein [Vibrio sp. SCSIO 43135]
MRWERLLFLIICLFTPMSYATIYSSPMLNEANNLVDIVPLQAKALATNYLTQRELTTRGEKSPSTISRDEADSRNRTPSSSIDALKILAQAEFNLNNARAANMHLEEAERLATTHQLPYLGLSVQILKTRLNWLQTRDTEATQKRVDQLQLAYNNIANADQLAKGIHYRLVMLQAEMASYEKDIDKANTLYQSLSAYIDNVSNKQTYIDYHLAYGKHYLDHKLYNLALSELLASYWQSIESNSSAQLAKVNRQLARLFYERRVLDKALDHLSQAADFYDNFQNSPALVDVLKRMGDVYYQQGKYNLALVHYFNVIDHERNQNNIEDVIEIRISLAATYLQLYNYPLTEQYLNRAEELLEYADVPRLNAHALLLNAGLAYSQKKGSAAVNYAQQALDIGLAEDNLRLKTSAYQMLYLGYELVGQFDKSLENLKKYNSLVQIQQNTLNLINEEAFRQQKEFVEQTLHLAGQTQELEETHVEYRKFQKVALALFIFSFVLLLLYLRRGFVLQRQREEIGTLNTSLYSHSRSTLRNLRMLNVKLPNVMQKTRSSFELWHVGDLIQEPLNDRLRFVMIDVPFLSDMYLQYGYESGLELEKAFGQYLKGKVESPARIYHFSDSTLLYIEPRTENSDEPEAIFKKIQNWILEFKEDKAMTRVIRVGIADYPFLPRAYTAINDKELIDILLMSTSVARTLSLKEHCSQWVYLKAIENAPAASLATGNIRKACKHSINQGLIKVHSSYKNEDSIKKLLKDE